MTMITGFETEVPAPPLPRRSRGLLIDALLDLPLVASRPSDPGDRDGGRPRARVEGGVIFCGVGCAPVTAWKDGVCSTVDLDLNLPADTDNGHAFGSFLVQADETNRANFYENWVNDRLRARLNVGVSAQLAAELQSGAATGNPSLITNATHVVAGSPTPVAEALFVLEDLASNFEARQFWFHMDPGTFVEMERIHDFRGDDSGVFTQTGHRVIADPGLDGSEGPEDPDGGGQVNTAANGRWIFASLPVVGWLGEPRQLGTETGRFDREHNLRTNAIVQPALLAFDPCAVFAVQTVVPTYTADV